LKSVENIAYKKRSMSRPTRGAWIEMDNGALSSIAVAVAPHAGRVD